MNVRCLFALRRAQAHLFGSEAHVDYAAVHVSGAVLSSKQNAGAPLADLTRIKILVKQPRIGSTRCAMQMRTMCVVTVKARAAPGSAACAPDSHRVRDMRPRTGLTRRLAISRPRGRRRWLAAWSEEEIS